jgi:hypothetical protein
MISKEYKSAGGQLSSDRNARSLLRDSSLEEYRIMPEDSHIVKIHPSSDFMSELKDSGPTLEELELILREWANKILDNIEPPPGLWKKIKRQARYQEPLENSCSS